MTPVPKKENQGVETLFHLFILNEICNCAVGSVLIGSESKRIYSVIYHLCHYQYFPQQSQQHCFGCLTVVDAEEEEVLRTGCAVGAPLDPTGNLL